MRPAAMWGGRIMPARTEKRAAVASLGAVCPTTLQAESMSTFVPSPSILLIPPEPTFQVAPSVVGLL